MLLREVKILRETDRDMASDAYYSVTRLLQNIDSPKIPDRDVVSKFTPIVQRGIVRSPISTSEADALVKQQLGKNYKEEDLEELRDSLVSAETIAAHSMLFTLKEILQLPEIKTYILDDPAAATFSKGNLLKATGNRASDYIRAIRTEATTPGSVLRNAYEVQVQAALAAKSEALTNVVMKRGSADGFATREVHALKGELVQLKTLTGQPKDDLQKKIVQTLELIACSYGTILGNTSVLLSQIPTGGAATPQSP